MISAPRRAWPLLAIVAVVGATAWLQQGEGENQNSHYALIKALASGTPRIDKTRGEAGFLSTQDITLYEGHVYSNKAPGLAFVSLPGYLALKAIGVRTTGDPTVVLWALGLWSLVLPTAVMLVLLMREADRLYPGSGALAAACTGAATLVLPFATLFFAHGLAAALLFSSFALAGAATRGRDRPALYALAGLPAGYAITTEYSTALGTAAIGLYATLSGGFAARRASAYAGGTLLGVAPLIAYNWWAFHSPLHNTYQGTTVGPGTVSGLFGMPDLQRLLEVLFSSIGFFVFSPLLVAAFCALPLLYRRDRSVGLLVIGLAAAFLVWEATYLFPFGGASPGPRFLTAVIPFLGLALVPAYRARPWTTIALAGVSAAMIAAVSATHPILAFDGHWPDRLARRELTRTAASLIDVTGWYTIVPFFAGVAVALVCAIAAAGRPRWSSRDAMSAAVAVAAWLVVFLLAPTPTELGGRSALSTYVLLLAIATVGAAVALLLTRVPPDTQPAFPRSRDQVRSVH